MGNCDTHAHFRKYAYASTRESVNQTCIHRRWKLAGLLDSTNSVQWQLLQKQMTDRGVGSFSIWLHNYLGFTWIVWGCIKMGCLGEAIFGWVKSWWVFAIGTEEPTLPSLATWRMDFRIIPNNKSDSLEASTWPGESDLFRNFCLSCFTRWVDCPLTNPDKVLVPGGLYILSFELHIFRALVSYIYSYWHFVGLRYCVVLCIIFNFLITISCL